jgi:hypothetical protein
MTIFELIIYLAHLWSQPWIHWITGLIVGLLVYLPVSSILFAQYAMWQGKSNQTAVYIIALFSGLISVSGALFVVGGLDAIYIWYNTPLGPPLEPFTIMAVLDSGYVRLWLPFIILAAIAIIPIVGIWYELHKMRRLKEQDNLFFTKLNQSPEYEAEDLLDERIK